MLARIYYHNSKTFIDYLTALFLLSQKLFAFLVCMHQDVIMVVS